LAVVSLAFGLAMAGFDGSCSFVMNCRKTHFFLAPDPLVSTVGLDLFERFDHTFALAVVSLNSFLFVDYLQSLPG
jgi:hypothetical protein